MGHRKTIGTAADPLQLVARLPWWAGVALAVVLYAVLHLAAAQPLAIALRPGQSGSFMVPSFGSTLASIGQYALPLLCLAGAGLSAWRSHERKAWVRDFMRGDDAVAMCGVTRHEFARFLREARRLHRYANTKTRRGRADGGVDLVLRRDGEKFAVQLVRAEPHLDHWTS